MKKILLSIIVLLALHCVAHASVATNLLAKVDSYRVCDFREYPYSIWGKVCWKFPVIGVRNVKGDFVAAGDYLVNKKYVSQEKKNFPLKAFASLIAQHDPKKEFPKWRMPLKITVIVLMYNKKGEYLGAIRISTNYDSFSIDSEQGYHFRFGNGAGGKHVSTIIGPLVK